MKGTTSLALAALLATGLATAAAEPASAQTPLSACGQLFKGSYKLTKNLTTTGHCFTLVNNFITLDLNGFVITGDAGSADYGIRTGATATLTGIEIRNGTITNFNYGIYLPSASGVVVERVRAVRNTGSGIFAGGSNCVLKDNVAAENGSVGLYGGGGGCVATGNTARNNGGHGLLLGFGSTVIGNAARDNGSIGIIAANPGSTVANNSSYSNDSYGIYVGCPSNVVGNTATANASTNIFYFGAGCGNNFNVAP